MQHRILAVLLLILALQVWTTEACRCSNWLALGGRRYECPDCGGSLSSNGDCVKCTSNPSGGCLQPCDDNTSNNTPIKVKNDRTTYGFADATAWDATSCFYGCEASKVYDVSVIGTWTEPRQLILVSSAPTEPVPTHCDGTSVEDGFPSLSISNLTKVSASGTNYQGIDETTNIMVCVSITEYAIAFPQFLTKRGTYVAGSCPPGPPYRDSCPLNPSTSTGTTVIALKRSLTGLPYEYFPLKKGVWSGNWMAVSSGNSTYAKVQATITIKSFNNIYLSVSSGSWYYSATGQYASKYDAWNLDIWAIQNKESPGYFTAKGDEPVCFIWTKEIFAMTWGGIGKPCPIAPYVAYNNGAFEQQVMQPWF